MDAAPLVEGFVAIRDGRIMVVGRGRKPETMIAADLPSSYEIETRDFGNAAILPGLVNAHTHLDFSDLAAPLGTRGVAFADWLRLVLEYRRTTANEPRQNIALGLAESIRWGVTTLGDIVQPTWQPQPPPPQVVAFRELVAPTADRVAAAMETAAAHLRKGEEPYTAGWQAALSPHAAYTVHFQLLEKLSVLSAARGIPLAFHLAESREELELLEHGAGPLRRLLEECGFWSPESFAMPRRPLHYLQLLANAYHALIVHGNYLDDEEIAFLGAHAARLSVVYCPRSHAWFGHAPHPLEKMLQSGVHVALGSDSRASAPNLNLMADIRQVARRHPSVPLKEVFRMATLHAAQTLKQDAEVGSLTPGKQADLVVFSLPEHESDDPYRLLLEAEEPPRACYWRGLPVGESRN